MAVGYTNGDDTNSVRAIALDALYRAVNRHATGAVTKASLLAVITTQFQTYFPGKALPAASAP